MRLMNSAIGKLYRHLQLNPKDQDGAKTEIILKEDTSHTENINILTFSSVQPDETFHDIVLKIKIFEKEFQRQRVQQQRELKRLQEEIKRLNKNSTELRKENERIKGVQPIVTKAKGKQVEKIEERFRTEKRGMEEKIHELEDGMKRNLAHLLHDKDETRSQIRFDVDSLVSAVNNVHQMVTGHYHDITAINKTTDNGDILPTKDILAMLTNVAGGVQLLKSKTNELSNEIEQLSTWQQCLRDVEKDITRFNQAFSDEDKEKNSIPYHDDDPYSILTSCRTKLKKSKDKINAKLKAAADSTSLFKRNERDMTNLRRNMDLLRAEITKLHEHVISVQMQDISISMLTFERRNDPGERSDGSTDELPEADRQDLGDMVEKLKQVGTMVSHFQQLIIDRTSILTKMEDDMLPLKIRVNRLHEEITKSMNNSASPEHDLADDILRSRRTISPEEPANVFSREINNMLTKLSKMELAIRHLLETFATSNGRASI